MSKKTTGRKHKVQPAPIPMRTWIIGGAIIGLIAALAIFLPPFLSRTASSAQTLPAAINVVQAAQMRSDGAFILDVREQVEWDEYHVPDSTLIPLGTLASRVSELPRDKEIVVVCRSGNRSQEGRDILLRAGFTDVTSMSGGLVDWRSQGFPTVSGP